MGTNGSYEEQEGKIFLSESDSDYHLLCQSVTMRISKIPTHACLEMRGV